MERDRPQVLVIDDEPTTLDFFQEVLTGLGFEPILVDNGPQAIALYSERIFDLVLTDLRMPGMDGIELIQQLKAQRAGTIIIVMTGYGSIESAVQAMKVGATDYLTKPVDLEHLEIVLTSAWRQCQQAEELRLLKEQVVQQNTFEGLVGISQKMQHIYRLIRRFAASDMTVLIQGETGTGKELVSRALHRQSPRRQARFIPLNCGALAETILESELFGHEKGAFTGAIKQKLGLIEQAEGGTLFLDEIDATSPALQVILLRVLQEREVLRVGGYHPIQVDFRLIAATNVDLYQCIEQKTFRKDLFYRLKGGIIELPSLRERPEDIPLIAQHFTSIYSTKNNKPRPEILPEGMMLLKNYPWPGNVRELEYAIEQAVLCCQEGKILPADLPECVIDSGAESGSQDLNDMSLRTARARFERQYLANILVQTKGNVSAAARKAGIHRRHFYEKMNRYGLSRQ